MRRSVCSSLGLALLLAVAPAGATDVTFSGTLNSACILAVTTPGTLNITASGALSSEAGLPAILAILSVGSNTLTVDPPVWITTAPGYVAGTETFEVAYSGLAGLGLADQAFTDAQTTRTLGALPVSLLTMNARAGNSLGFANGDYAMKVVVTCS